MTDRMRRGAGIGVLGLLLVVGGCINVQRADPEQDVGDTGGGDDVVDPVDTVDPPEDTIDPPEDTIGPEDTDESPDVRDVEDADDAGAPDVDPPPEDTGPDVEPDTCTLPSCGDKVCGFVKNDCGTVTCGECGGDEACTTDGQCVEVCEEDCGGKECGPDGCGGSCGHCGSDASCQDGKCVPDHICGDGECSEDEIETCPEDCDICEPHCDGQECGSDGCGGHCGMCVNATCIQGQCVGDPTNCKADPYCACVVDECMSNNELLPIGGELACQALPAKCVNTMVAAYAEMGGCGEPCGGVTIPGLEDLCAIEECEGKLGELGIDYLCDQCGGGGGDSCGSSFDCPGNTFCVEGTCVDGDYAGEWDVYTVSGELDSMVWTIGQSFSVPNEVLVDLWFELGDVEYIATGWITDNWLTATTLLDGTFGEDVITIDAAFVYEGGVHVPDYFWGELVIKDGVADRTPESHEIQGWRAD